MFLTPCGYLQSCILLRSLVLPTAVVHLTVSENTLQHVQVLNIIYHFQSDAGNNAVCMWVCLFTTKIHPAHMFPLGKTLVGEYNHFRALISPFTVTQLLLLLVASSTKLQQLRAIPLAIAATISTTAGALLSNISFK
jgi:hypothetical protein